MAASWLLIAPSCIDFEDEPEEEASNSEETEKESDNKDSKKDDSSKTTEVQKACSLINDIRKNPDAYSSQMGVDLSDVEARPALTWNAALAKVAQDKAEDMANNDYFSHTDLKGYGVNYYIHEAGYDIPADWYADKSDGYFENIAAGNSTAEAMVKQLIYDSGRSHASAGHRASLLGISDWCSNCIDIGIGYSYNANSTYKHYWSVIIAKHNY